MAGPDVIGRYDLGMLVAQVDGLDPALVPAGSIADLELRLPTTVGLRIDAATSVLRTPLRGTRNS